MTLAWSSMSHGAINPVEGENWTFRAELEKYIIDVDGNHTTNPLQGAYFILFRINDDGTSAQIGLPRPTNEYGRIMVTDLEPGDYYFLEYRVPNGYDFDVEYVFCDDEDDYVLRIKTRYFFTITGNELINEETGLREPVLVRVYNRRQSGDLIITKRIVREDGELPTYQQEDILFDFIVTFDDDGEHYYLLNGTGDPIRHISGDIIRLRHNESAVFLNLPVGVGFHVTEKPMPGFTISAPNHQGTITAPSDDDDGIRVVLVTNTYVGEDVGSLLIRKVVPNGSGEYFTFRLFINGSDEYYREFQIQAGEYYRIDNIPTGTPYRIIELPHPNYRPRNEYFTGTIISNHISEYTEYTFYNDYYYDPSEYGSLTISKTVPGGSDETFIFVVTIDGMERLPHIELQAGQSYTIYNLPHDAVWTVVELPHDDYLSATDSATGTITGGQPSYAPFTNHRRPAQEYVDISITKVVEGDMPNPLQEFEFTLTVNDEITERFNLRNGETATFTIPAGALYTFTEVNIPDGFSLIRVEYGHQTAVYNFSAIFTNRFDGTWYIDINGEKTWQHPDGIMLPENIVLRLMNGDIIVRELIVTPDADGYWHYIFENLPKFNANGQEIAYTIVEIPIISWRPIYNGFDIENIYIPPAISSEILVEKQIIGNLQPSVSTNFHFILTGHDNAPMPIGSSTDNVSSLFILGARTGSFGTIAFTNPGEFVYTIHEVNTGTGSYIFDEFIYTLTIVVEEDDTGALIIISETLTRDGEDATRIIFVNEYTGTHSGTVTITGQKHWNHGSNPEASQPGYVVFMLYADGVRFISFRVDALTDWWYSFELPRYNQDGTEIVWTVDEEYIPNYNKAISGLSITNTHISVTDPNWRPPGGNRPPGNNNVPGTGDNSRQWFWFGLGIISITGLAVLIIISIKHKRNALQN